MQVTNIRESGSANTLRWAIANNAELKDNLPLASVINDELFYLVQVEGVNFYELFRLTQLYRNKIKICNINRASIPSMESLGERFPGNEGEVMEVLSMFSGMVTQMLADNDIIAEGAAQLFLPMITTTFTVQLPFAFIDVLEAMTDDEATKLFSAEYQRNLETICDGGNAHSLPRSILISIERNTSNIRYDGKYEQLIRSTKYFVLKDYPQKLFKIGLLGFAKFDNVTRGEARCNMFKPDPATFKQTMKQLSRLRSPLELSFAVQLPLYYMQLLESSYFPEDLKISHRSSINSILDNGLVFHDFQLVDGDEDQESSINNYKVRISEANLACLKTINAITQSDAPSHAPSIFALLPPIYQSTAVITFLVDDLPLLTQHSNPVIQEMFTEIQKISNGIVNELQRS